VIEPHGGKLIDLVANESEKKELLNESDSFKKVKLPLYKLRELENIATGLFSPLEGFMGYEDYASVIKDMRLINKIVWSIPIILPVEEEIFKDINNGEKVALTDTYGKIYGIMEVNDEFQRDKKLEAIEIFKTTDENHPGVHRIYAEPDYAIGGTIKLLERLDYGVFEKYKFDPKETRKLFKDKGWETIVAFQTRNPVHRAHEYLQKTALEMVDGLFLNPLVGETKASDIPADVRMKTYEVILGNYYPKDRVVLGVFPANMFYAGPKEAIFHAICRKNFGCTHFIVGRDHAGAGNYYGTYDAQEIFNQFKPEEIGIIPLKFENAFYCTKCESMATAKTCPHGNEFHIYLSGTKVREMLSEGKLPPKEFMRPEVAKILLEYYNERGDENV